MSNYTTQTAALKAVTIDTAKLDAKQIDTKKLFINGELFDPSKESPNEAKFTFSISPFAGGWQIESYKANWVDYGPDEQWWESIVYNGGYLMYGSQTEGVLPNGVYVMVEIDDNFAKCIGGNSLNDTDGAWLYNIPLAKFELANLTSTLPRYEQCILENFITTINYEGTENIYWVIKFYEEDDNLSEIFGGITEENPHFMFLISIPYYIPENDTPSSTYSLRKTNIFDSLRERFEQMKQRFEERKQQMLDKSAE